MHAGALAFVMGMIDQYGLRPKTVLEIGAWSGTGSARLAFDGIGVASWQALDIEAGPGVDIVADGATYDPPERFDMVICMEVLEHTPLAREIVINACRLLGPGGVVLITAAGPNRAMHTARPYSDMLPNQMQPEEWYANISRDELLQWLLEGDTDICGVTLSPRGDDVYGYGVKVAKPEGVPA